MYDLLALVIIYGWSAMQTSISLLFPPVRKRLEAFETSVIPRISWNRVQNTENQPNKLMEIIHTNRKRNLEYFGHIL